MESTVRKAGLGDESVLAVMMRVLERKYGTHPGGDAPAPISTRFVVDQFQGLLRRSNVRAWVAESGGETVGYVLARFYCRRRDAKQPAALIGVVEQLVTYCEDDERLPLVEQLLAAVYEQARAEGLRHVELGEMVVDYLKRCGADPSQLDLPKLDDSERPTQGR